MQSRDDPFFLVEWKSFNPVPERLLDIALILPLFSFPEMLWDVEDSADTCLSKCHQEELIFFICYLFYFSFLSTNSVI